MTKIYRNIYRRDDGTEFEGAILFQTRKGAEWVGKCPVLDGSNYVYTVEVEWDGETYVETDEDLGYDE